MAPGDELVDVVDDAGNIIATATRRDVRERNLLHRSVFIVVVNEARDALLAHQRADWKDVWPSRWDIAFGGVVAAGEAWEDAARRELAEEAGVRPPLDELGEGRYEDAIVREISRVYEVSSDGPFSFPDGEVVATTWVPFDQLPSWIAEREVCPDSESIVSPFLR